MGKAPGIERVQRGVAEAWTSVPPEVDLDGSGSPELT